jgi:uncharacterized protein (DUF488 family)
VLYTIGHSNKSAAEIVDTLEEFGVEHLVDVRHFPRSRAQPQFNLETFPDALARAGIRYTHLEALGGRRPKSRAIAPDVNAGWTHQAFHNYADYALTDEFQAGLTALLALAEHETCAIMCAEVLWWRCHRRIISDYLMMHGVSVRHIMTREKCDAALPTPFAVRAGDGLLTYG